MAGPWEKYQKAASEPEAEGPWAKYQAAPSGPSPGMSGLRGAISGATAGFDDEFTGAVGAVGRVAGVKNLGSWKPFDPNSHLEMASEPLSADEIVKAYRENRDSIRGEQKRDMATNPKATIAGNLAGAIISPASKLKAAQGMGPLSRGATLANEMKTAALQGAAFGAGGSDADLTRGEVGRFAADTALGAASGAAVPPAIAGVKGAAGAAAGAGKWAGKKLFSSLFGVTEENASKYLARRAEINAAPELADIKAAVDDEVQKLSAAVDAGKVNVEQATARLSDLKQQVRNQLTDAKVDAREALRRSELMLQEAAAKVVQPLKDTRAPTALANDVVNAIGDLKGVVQGESGRALETLNTSGAKIDLSGVYSRLDDTISKLRGAGTDEANGVADRLADYKARLMSKNWANISAPEAKKLIQGLDAITDYNPLAGSFDKAKNAAFKGVRGSLDEALKGAVPEYRAQMAELAPKADLLGKASAAFGDERRAIGRLGQVAGPKGALDREALAELENATGRQGAFTKPIDEYTRAQSILKDPAKLEEMRRSLPEYAAYRQAMAKLAKMKPDWTREQLESALAKSKEARAIAAAEDGLKKAAAKLEPVSMLTPGSTESKLKAVMRPSGSTIETEKALAALEAQTGKKFLQPLEDRAVLDAFSKPYAHGARNTVLWTVIGTAFGGLPGAGVGASYGQLVDRYGPKMGKAILDGVAKLKEAPSVQTIRELSLPPEVKSEMEMEFRLYVISRQGLEAAPRQVAESDQPKTGPDRWAAKGLEKLGITDPATREKLLASKEGKQLLIEASDLSPDSPAMKRIKEQIKKGWDANATRTGSAPEVPRQQREPARGR